MEIYGNRENPLQIILKLLAIIDTYSNVVQELSDSTVITLDFKEEINYYDYINKLEKYIFEQYYLNCNRNVAEVARRMGLKRSTTFERLQKYNIV